MTERKIGKIKSFNDSKGYGFIEQEKGDDIFVHFRAIRGEGFRSLQSGQSVTFKVSESEKGLQAEEVEVFIPDTY